VKYSRFEMIVVGVSMLVVAALLATSPHDVSSVPLDFSASLLLVIVLWAALHFGRRGGLAAAIGAAALYVVLNIPAMTAAGGLTSEALLVVIGRVSMFGLLGIVGGELAARLRHLFSRQGHAGEYDEWGHAFNERYAENALRRAFAAFDRHQQPFSLVLLSMSREITAGMGPQRARSIVRAVSAHLRGDLRMVDEIARLDDGRFAILLPSTGADGAAIVTARVIAGVQHLLGAKPESVSGRSLSLPQDVEALQSVLAELAREPEAPDEAYEAESGAYSSAGDSDRNPALESAESAPGPSTLKMSTAAAPEGSTKQ
jgi:GGDEF domain-containing protein